MPVEPPPLFPGLAPPVLTAVGDAYAGDLLVASALPWPVTPMHAGAAVSSALAAALQLPGGTQALAWHRVAEVHDGQLLREELARLKPRRVVVLGEALFERLEAASGFVGLVTAPALGVAAVGRLGGALTVVAADELPDPAGLAALGGALRAAGALLTGAQRAAFERLSGYPWDGHTRTGRFPTDRPFGDASFTGPPWDFGYEPGDYGFQLWLQAPGAEPERYLLQDDGEFYGPPEGPAHDDELDADAEDDDGWRAARGASSRRARHTSPPATRRPRP